MFFEHLVAKSFKQFFLLVIFIYARVLLLILNENNVKWNHELHQNLLLQY